MDSLDGTTPDINKGINPLDSGMPGMFNERTGEINPYRNAPSLSKFGGGIDNSIKRNITPNLPNTDRSPGEPWNNMGMSYEEWLKWKEGHSQPILGQRQPTRPTPVLPERPPQPIDPYMNRDRRPGNPLSNPLYSRWIAQKNGLISPPSLERPPQSNVQSLPGTQYPMLQQSQSLAGAPMAPEILGNRYLSYNNELQQMSSRNPTESLLSYLSKLLSG